MRRPHRSPPCGQRYGMAIPSRRAVRWDSVSYAHPAERGKPAGSRPLLLGDSRCSCECALHGPMYGDGTSCGNGCGLVRKPTRGPSRTGSSSTAKKSSQSRSHSLQSMNMSFLRTVIGDVEASQAGVCYAHEHIIIDHSFTTYCYPDFLLDSVERASIDVAEFYALGGRPLLDSMPCGGGRNAAKLAEVCRRTKVNIVCPTGLHLAKSYAPGHWGERLGAEELAEWFVADIEQGIDSAAYNGPQISRTPHKAGVIKAATGQYSPNARERKIVEAAAMAHHRTEP